MSTLPLTVEGNDRGSPGLLETVNQENNKSKGDALIEKYNTSLTLTTTPTSPASLSFDKLPEQQQIPSNESKQHITIPPLIIATEGSSRSDISNTTIDASDKNHLLSPVITTRQQMAKSGKLMVYAQNYLLQEPPKKY